MRDLYANDLTGPAVTLRSPAQRNIAAGAAGILLVPGMSWAQSTSVSANGLSSSTPTQSEKFRRHLMAGYAITDHVIGGTSTCILASGTCLAASRTVNSPPPYWLGVAMHHSCYWAAYTASLITTEHDITTFMA